MTLKTVHLIKQNARRKQGYAKKEENHARHKIVQTWS